jgi:peroxiredoxin
MKFLLGCVSIFFCLAFQQSAGYGVGDTVADFELSSAKGTLFRLQDLNNSKGCIVVFSSSSCGFAQGYAERIASLDKKYSGLGYPLLLIDPQGAGGEAGYTVLLDPEQKVLQQFGATRLPQTFVLKKVEDRWVVKYIGAIDDNADQPREHYVQEALDALLQDRDIIRTRTVALGCSARPKR